MTPQSHSFVTNFLQKAEEAPSITDSVSVLLGACDLISNKACLGPLGLAVFCMGHLLNKDLVFCFSYDQCIYQTQPEPISHCHIGAHGILSLPRSLTGQVLSYYCLPACIFFPLFFSLVGWMLMRWTLISMLVHFFGPKHSICKYANRNDYKSIIYFCAIKVVSECSGWVDDINFIYSNFYELILNNKCHDMWPWTTQLFIKVFF